jgi:hypothetical protein
MHPSYGTRGLSRIALTQGAKICDFFEKSQIWALVFYLFQIKPHLFCPDLCEYSDD